MTDSKLSPQDAFIGIDLGGTRIRAGRFDYQLQLEQRIETLTRDMEGQEAVIARIVEQAQAVWPDDRRVRCVGVSVPGPVNPHLGLIAYAPNLWGWQDVPLQHILEQRLGTQVRIGNDANLAALAETTHGAARGSSDVIYMTISTGIGTGVVSHRQLLLGSQGYAAECGHMIMVVDGDCVSTLEKEAAGPAIARKAVQGLERGEESLIADLVEDHLDAINAVVVGKAARMGDRLALGIIEQAGFMVGLGIVTLLHTFNPQTVVLGGGVMEGLWDLLYPPMRTAIERYCITDSYWQSLKILPAQLGEDVCLIGAAALAGHEWD